jgi:hypothetical protein
MTRTTLTQAEIDPLRTCALGLQERKEARRFEISDSQNNSAAPRHAALARASRCESIALVKRLGGVQASGNSSGNSQITARLKLRNKRAH